MAACKIMLNLMLLLVLISAVVSGETSSNGSTPPFQNVSVTTPKSEDQSETSMVSPPPTTTGTRTTTITSTTNTADSTCTMDITYFSDHISDFTIYPDCSVFVSCILHELDIWRIALCQEPSPAEVRLQAEAVGPLLAIQCTGFDEESVVLNIKYLDTIKRN